MNKIITLLCYLSLISCFNTKPQNTHELIYEFENSTQLSDADREITITVLKERLERFSSDFEVTLTNDKNVKIIAKTSFDERRFNSIITNQGKLEFWELYKGESFHPFIIEANNLLKNEIQGDSINYNPILDVAASGGFQYGPMLLTFKAKDTAFINKSLNQQDIRALLPDDYKYTKFLWGIPDNVGELPLYAAKTDREAKPFVTGENITDAKQSYNAIDRPTVSVQLDENGAKRWERMTEIAFQQQTSIAITLNNLVYSAPGVTSGPIRGGSFEISGSFTLEEAQDLAVILSSSKRIPKLKLLKASIINN